MTPFEAFAAHGSEAFVDSGKEARAGEEGDPFIVQIVALAAIDESIEFYVDFPQTYRNSKSAFDAAVGRASRRENVEFIPMLRDYRIFTGVNPYNPLDDLIKPTFESLPSGLRSIVRDIRRDEDPDTGGGILESHVAWINTIDATVDFDARGSVFLRIHYDVSGSMKAEHFNGVPETTAAVLKEREGPLFFGSATQRTGERWLDWLTQVWVDFENGNP